MAIIETSADTETQIVAASADTTWLIKEGVTVSVDDDAIYAANDAADRTFLIDGHISAVGGWGMAIGGSAFNLRNQVYVGGTGSIFSEFYGIGSVGDRFRAVNSGTITAGTTGINADGDLIQVYNYGQITAGIAVNLFGDDNVVFNAGMMSGEIGVVLNGVLGSSSILYNSGVVSGSDTAVSGGSGDDTVVNSGIMNGNADLGSGNDRFENNGGTLNGAVLGRDGDDTYVVDDAGIVIIELDGQGDDTIESSVSTALAFNVETLVLTGVSGLTGNGNSQANILYGNIGDNRLNGLSGADSLLGGSGADVLDGGAGLDTASYAEAEAAVTIDLGKGKASGGEASGDRFISIENLAGSEFNDKLTGSSAANVIFGGGGNDKINGGKGNDSLNGEKDDDTFIFSTGSGKDEIVDFGTIDGNNDKVDLRHLAGINSFSDLKSHHMKNVGDDVQIKVGSDILLIRNHQEADLHAGDFMI